MSGWTCAASRGLADPPQDCDMPFCGCNPAWSEALGAAQEAGWISRQDADTLRMRAAGRCSPEAGPVVVDAPRDPAAALAKMLGKLDAEDQACFNWCLALARDAGLRSTLR